MSTTLQLSEVIISNPQIESFRDLLLAVRQRAKVGDKMFLDMDLKPDYIDTPRKWEFMVEDAFVGGQRDQ